MGAGHPQPDAFRPAHRHGPEARQVARQSGPSPEPAGRVLETAAPRAAARASDRAGPSTAPACAPGDLGPGGAAAAAPAGRAAPAQPPIRLADLDPVDRELLQIVLNEPGAVAYLVSRVSAASLRDAPLRAILQACYDLHGEGQRPSAKTSCFALTTRRFAPWRPRLRCRSTPPPCPRRCVPPPGKIASRACSPPWPSASGKTGSGTSGWPWPRPTKWPTRTLIVPYD